MKIMILLLALVSLNVRADEIVSIDLTGSVPDSNPTYGNDPYDVMFDYDMTTGAISGLGAWGPCSGTNPQVTSLSGMNGSYLTMSGTESAGGCQTVAFSGAVDLTGATNGEHLFGGLGANYQAPAPSPRLLAIQEPTGVPEPGTLPLMVLGFVALYYLRQYRVAK